MAGFLDFLHSAMGGAGQGAQPAASGPGSAADPFNPTPTLQQPGLLSGIDPKQLQQAGAGMADGQSGADPSQTAIQQLLQLHAQRQQQMQQLLGGR